MKMMEMDSEQVQMGKVVKLKLAFSRSSVI